MGVRLLTGWVLALLATVAGAEPAERIVTLSPHLAEMVYAAGAGDRLAGVVSWSDYPPAVRDLPRVGDAFRVDFEALRSLGPDLVLVWESGNPPELRQRLRAAGYRVVSLEPRELEDIPAQIERIGRLAGTPEAAARSADRFRETLDGLRADVPDGPRLRVFFQISAEPWFTVTGRHVVDRVIRLCGGRNVFADLPGLAPSVGLEAIVAADPEVIVVASSEPEGDWRDGWMRWNSVTAVRNDALFAVDPDLISRPGPRLADGARALCAALAASR